jgi:putative transposase
VRFVAEHKDRTDGGKRWGVESICAVLTEHGCPIAPSTYYDAASRLPSQRAQRDEDLKVEIARVHAANYSVYGHGRCGSRSTGRASRWPAARSSG